MSPVSRHTRAHTSEIPVCDQALTVIKRILVAGRGSEHVTLERRPATVDNLTEATKHSKIFPGVVSESDLQKWRTSKDRKSPSLSQVGPDSIKHKFSLQDNGSAKYFQGAMHASNMGEKVAQVSHDALKSRNFYMLS
ncbi:uncharacterized protein LOC143361509 [Halictus rubicundus]|uniref:uncharacterized protein LOC143361509 n=1 Tax=Halictus rubicundus TaxID=77578 RepID=UPI004036D382